MARPVEADPGRDPGVAHRRQAAGAGDEGSGAEGPADPGQAAVAAVSTKPSGARATRRAPPHLYGPHDRDGARTISVAVRIPARASVLSAGADRLSDSLQHRDEFSGGHTPQPRTASA